MERRCFTLRVRPGQEAEYRRRHDEIWPELVEAFHVAGLRDFTLYMRGREVIGTFTVDAPDPAAALARLDEQEASIRWSEHMDDVIEAFDAESPVDVWHID